MNVMDGEKIEKQKTFMFPSFYPWDRVEDRINNIKLTTPRYAKDFYEIKSERELEDLKKCLLKELQEKGNDR